MGILDNKSAYKRGILFKNLSSIYKSSKMIDDKNIKKNIEQAITNIYKEFDLPNPIEI